MHQVRLPSLVLAAGLLAAGAPAPCVFAAAAAEAPQTSGINLLGIRPGSEVFMDGTRVGVAPLSAPLPASPGEHHLRVTLLGYAPFEDTIVVPTGRIAIIEIDQAPTAGVLRVRSTLPEVAVYVDDQLVGTAPVAVELRTGPHGIKLRSPGYNDQLFDLAVSPGEEITRDAVMVPLVSEHAQKSADPRERKIYTRWWLWTSVILGVAVVTTAVVVPVIYATKTDCERLSVEVCSPIKVGMTQPLAQALYGMPQSPPRATALPLAFSLSF